MIGSIVIKNNPIGTATNFSESISKGFAGYTHSNRAIGGHYKCSFNLYNNLEDYLYNGLMRKVNSYSEDGGLAWEGYISKMELFLNDKVLTVSIDSMSNRIWVRYTEATDGLVTPSTVAEDTDSQDLYGIKESVLIGGTLSSTVADQVAQNKVNTYAYPRKPFSKLKAGRGNPYMKVTCSGYFSTLDWIRYNQTAAQGTQLSHLQIADIITSAGQYVDSSQLATGDSVVSKEYDRDDRAGEAISAIARASDSNNERYLVGMRGGRVFKYEKVTDIDTSPELIDYGYRVRSGKAEVSELGSGRVIDLSMVRAGKWVKAEDAYGSSVSGVTPLKDPRNSFAETVTYTYPDTINIDSNRASQLNNLVTEKTASGEVLI